MLIFAVPVDLSGSVSLFLVNKKNNIPVDNSTLRYLSS